MKKYKLITLCMFLGLLVVAYSCKKIDIPNTNQIEVAILNSGSNNIIGNVTVDPGTAFGIDFTVNSPVDMEYVYIYKNGTEVTKDQLTTNKRYFRGTKSFTADVAAGVYTYRILAKDKAGIYLGEKNIVVTVNSDFYYYTNKNLYVPDTTAKTNPTYYASLTNQVLSYTDAVSKSASVDFGYFYDPALTGTTVNGHTIYALNVTPVPSAITMYDLTNFTKNATLLKLVTAPTFASITSSSALQTAGVANLGSGTTTSVKGLATGKLILFKTVGGKYGMINVNYVKQDNASKGTFMNIDVKIQK